MADLSQKAIRKLFDYEEGYLRWRVSLTGSVDIGSVAGHLDKRDYITIGVDGVNHYAARLIWIYHHGVIPNGLQVDHRDRVRSNNRIENLRLVTHQENTFNNDAKGYHWNKQNKNWRARIQVDGKSIDLGSHSTEESAREAYLSAKQKYHAIEERGSIG